MNTNPARKRTDLTLHQLRIFWAVAHGPTLTAAAKQLGITQPSLSQQLARMEEGLGTPLFHRRSNAMELTEAGIYLLPRAEQVLRAMQELDDGLVQYSFGQRVTIRIAGITSVLRVLLPPALKALLELAVSEVDIDIHERAPAEILELLYSRRVHIGLLAENSVAEAGIGFAQVPLVKDPYVLAVPTALNLDGVSDPRSDLPPDQFATLNRSVIFAFGTQHANRVQAWFERLLPESRIVAQCRSFEVATELVRAGTGVCLMPALSAVHGSATLEGVKLYRIKAPPRRLVALVPSQYQHVEPYAGLLTALQQAANDAPMPETLDVPAFLNEAPTARF